MCMLLILAIGCFLDETIVKMFVSTGKNIGEFKDSAGIVVDSMGNMIIADARK